MIRLTFATLYLTLTALFLFQMRSGFSDPVLLALLVAAGAVSVWHLVRVVRGVESAPRLTLRRG